MGLFYFHKQKLSTSVTIHPSHRNLFHHQHSNILKLYIIPSKNYNGGLGGSTQIILKCVLIVFSLDIQYLFCFGTGKNIVLMNSSVSST